MRKNYTPFIFMVILTLIGMLATSCPFASTLIKDAQESLSGSWNSIDTDEQSDIAEQTITFGAENQLSIEITNDDKSTETRNGVFVLYANPASETNFTGIVIFQIIEESKVTDEFHFYFSFLADGTLQLTNKYKSSNSDKYTKL